MILALLLTSLLTVEGALPAHILMLTLGGTKSHKVPFLELGQGLKARGHDITLVSAFPPAQTSPLRELAPLNLVLYVKNFTNWDLLGPKLRGEEAIAVLDIVKYSYQVCDAFYSSPEIKQLLSHKVDLLVIDGAYPECLLGLVHHFSVPFLYLNTVAFYTAQISLAGSPTVFSVTPFMDYPHSDRMSFWERSKNGFLHVASQWLLSAATRYLVEPVVRKHLGSDVPPVHSIGKNVSLILQHGHHSVTYPRPYLPGVVEVACLHCRAVQPLPDKLERFVCGGEKKGFVYVSFGTSVKSKHMPEVLRLMMIQVFSQLPYQVLWKYEEDPENMPDLPKNVRLGRWLPQQDLLGHPEIKAFVSHGGLHSVLEAVYHATPMVTLPVFCDQAANSFKAAQDGYALALEIKDLNAENFLAAVNKVVSDRRYRQNAQHRSQLLRDQPEAPLVRALYWVEYVLRHRGAPHLQGAAKDLSFVQYFMLDTIGALVVALYVILLLFKGLCYRFVRSRKSLKLKIK